MRTNTASHGAVDLLVIAALLGVISACASEGEVTVPGGSVTWDNALKTYTVNVPSNRCWEGTFHDANGNQVGGTVSGQGPDAGHMPEGTVSFKYKEVPCNEEGEYQGEPLPDGFDLFKYTSGTVVIDSVGSGDIFEHIEVLASSEVGADQKYANVVVGRSLPAYTTVNAIMTYTVSATQVLIESSLPSRFVEFEIEVNGTSVAELGNGVIVSGAGNGWVTATTVLPLAYFAPGNDVRISQQGVQAGAAATLDLTF